MCRHRRIAAGLPVTWDESGFHRPAVCLDCGQRLEITPADDDDAEFEALDHDDQVYAAIVRPNPGSAGGK